jgi:hypothetical protein
MIIKTRNVDPCTERGARILIKESDRDVSSLEESWTDNSNLLKGQLFQGKCA